MALKARMWGASKLFVLAIAFLATYLVFAATAMRVALRVREVPVPDLRNRTVTDATTTLADQGLVTIRQGRRTRVNLRQRPGGPGAPPTVCVVAPVSRETLGRGDHPVLLEVHAQLAAHGIEWEEVFDATLGGAHPERRLAELAAGRRGVFWLVMSASAAFQRWFEESGALVLVLGSCHAGVKLPSRRSSTVLTTGG